VPVSNLRSDVHLVQIPVTVTDLRGQPLIALNRSAFRVFEDEVERPVTAFSITDAPISATLVFDSSRSMKGRISDARAAVEQFLKTAMPADEFSLVRFSDKAEVLTRFTRDAAEISLLSFVSRVDGRRCSRVSGTQEIRKAHNQRRVVASSDGGDNNSIFESG
jgi:VWFA-related protein